MALFKKKFSEIPSDAILLTEDEALKYQLTILRTWKHRSDVFAFNYGAYVLGGASFLTGLFINSHFRNKFHLYGYGRVSSYLPICGIPALVSITSHWLFVLTDVVLQKENCPVCIQMRASALQAFCGCVFPFILAPLATLPLVHKYGTYDVPYITTQPKKVFQLLKSTTKPIANLMLAIFIGHALLGTAVSYFEGQSVLTVNMKLALLEQQLENS